MAPFMNALRVASLALLVALATAQAPAVVATAAAAREASPAPAPLPVSALANAASLDPVAGPRVESRGPPVVVLAVGDRPVAPGKPVFEGSSEAAAVDDRVKIAQPPAVHKTAEQAAAAAGTDAVNCGPCVDLCAAAGLRGAAPGATPAPRPRRALAGDDGARALGEILAPLPVGQAVAKAVACGCACV
jgi:hypothetical protein